MPLGKGRLLNWSSEKNHSIWYPSVKIFQQTKPGDWSDPINKIEKGNFKMSKLLNIFVGFDQKEAIAYHTFVQSIIKTLQFL